MGQKSNMKRLRKEVSETITNLQTGEVTKGKTSVTYFPPRFDEEKGYLWWPQKAHTRSFCAVHYPREVSMIDRGRLATLAKYIWSKTNMLGYKGHGGIRPYTVNQIAKLIETDVNQAERFLGRMAKFSIIKPIKVPFGEMVETQYYINPLYFFAGNRLSLNLYLIFREELDAHIPDYIKEEFAKGAAPGGDPDG